MSVIIPIAGHFSLKQGTHLIFCNGAATNRRTAECLAKKISTYLGGRPISLFYTPSQLNHDGVNRGSELNITSINMLASWLIKLARDKIAQVESGVDKTRIILFAHGHGTFLCKEALMHVKDVDPQFISCIEFNGFQPADFVSKELGKPRSVFNYILHADLQSDLEGGYFLGSNVAEVRQLFNSSRDISRIMPNLGDPYRGVERSALLDICCNLSSSRISELKMAIRDGRAFKWLPDESIAYSRAVEESQKRLEPMEVICITSRPKLGKLRPLSCLEKVAQLYNYVVWNVPLEHPLTTGFYSEALQKRCQLIAQSLEE